MEMKNLPDEESKLLMIKDGQRTREKNKREVKSFNKGLENIKKKER